MSILIKNAILNGRETHILIEENRISEIGKILEADEVIDAKGMIVMPGLVNTHTHAAMTLLRGYGDDMPLHQWLQERIWPAEAKLTGEMVYWGTRLAVIEMIKSGTTAFNDMYFFMEDVARAVADGGIRATLGYGLLDLFDEEKLADEIEGTEEFHRYVENLGNPMIQASVAPHAIYTVSKEGLEWSAEFAREHGLRLHIHVSETEKEVNDSIEQHGMSPVKYLDSMGFLGSDVIAAHSIWLSQEDMDIYAKRGVWPSHNPASNMKLGSGIMPYSEMRKREIMPVLGTDGAASNNNLDMMEEMKMAALLQKVSGDPTALPAHEAIRMATEWGAQALGINAGKIEEGYLADIILIRTDIPEMVPMHNWESNIVYSAKGSAVDTVICDGKILMRNRKIKGEEEVIRKAREMAERFYGD
jgi:5-methylthioadenosine/S-adenosylhomocysteine deaminase